MSTKQLRDGKTISYTCTGAVSSDAFVILGDRAYVAGNSGATGDVIPVYTEGVFTLTKKAGANLDFSQGEKVFHLATGSGACVPATGGGTATVGRAHTAAATGDTTVEVKLEPH